MKRRILTLALLGLFGGSMLAETAQACHKCGGRGRHGRTYTYNGTTGAYSGGGYGGGYGGGNCGGCAGGYAQPYSGYAQHASYGPAYAHQGMAAPGYGAPMAYGMR